VTHAVTITPSHDSSRRLLEAVRAANPALGVIVTGRLPAELDPFELISHWSGDCAYWHDDRGEALGLGVAAAFVATGPGRFHEIAFMAEEFAAEAFEGGDELRFFCGFAFDDAVQGSRWAHFGAARAVLPAITFRRKTSTDEWQVSIPVSRTTESDQISKILELVHLELGQTAANPGETSRRTSADFRALVRDAKQRIAAKHAAKIVAARRVDLELDDAVDPGVVARALNKRNAGCHRFAFRRGDSTFVGASPERLIHRSVDRVSTVALAGSAAPEDANQLLQSIKDHDEHEHVVRHVREALEPFCTSLDSGSAPSLRALNHVVHLETPFAGELREPVHVLRLAAALHPTPAVGGVPTEFARGWIRELEGADRGWYAGPIGWFDSNGDGELAVAIRSALIRGSNVSAWSGAGIVAESDPDSEMEEADRKLRPILAALGLT
jgi:isochorismate synthase